MKKELNWHQRAMVAAGIAVVTAGSASAALPEALATAFSGAATTITGNVSEIATIAVPVLAAILAMGAVWKLARRFFA